MNHCVPDWRVQDDSRPEEELVELLWQNGHVVMHSQTHRKAMKPLSEIKQCQKSESVLKGGPIKSSANVVQEAPSPWLQYTIDDDSFGKEFCQEFLYELPTTGSTPMVEAQGNKATKWHEAPEKDGTSYGSVLEQYNIPHFAETVMPHQSGFVSSLPQGTNIAGSAGDRNFTRSSIVRGEVGESSSMLAKESSICGSNQLHNFFHPSYTNTAKLASGRGVEEDARSRLSHERTQTDAHEIAITSSSGGSGCTVGRAGKPSANTRNHKRKGRDADESELQSEVCYRLVSHPFSYLTDGAHCYIIWVCSLAKILFYVMFFHMQEAEYESMETGRQSQRSASARRRRAAEVHNLSERRRRDRINEKMKALQELIPHCNKSDKASMLDEAIEYLKSLQLQVQVRELMTIFDHCLSYVPEQFCSPESSSSLQIMWMRSGLASMMFPGVHHYMPQMGMGMGHTSMPSVHGPIPFPRMPLVNQPVSSNPTVNQASFCPPSNPLNFPNQMQNPHVPMSYARYFGFQHMQPSPQMMNLFAYGAKLMQQNQAALGAGTTVTCGGDAPSENVQEDGNAGIPPADKCRRGLSVCTALHAGLHTSTADCLLPPGNK
ncbi:hypothetical protein Taro_036083 [Colocasia esculenta]|uniref:BHLH domain-containing protein n=1 Tax=Colocasia esculenta TaxID=4460 RepID=A0A843W7G9_COLES|nr:hypothetical protein [Colocasia esculenta]